MHGEKATNLFDRLKDFIGRGIMTNNDEYEQALQKFRALDTTTSDYANMIETPILFKNVSTFKGSCFSMNAEFFATKEQKTEGE